MSLQILIGYVILQRSGAGTVLSIWHLWSPSHLLMVKMRRRTVMLFQASSQTLWRSPLTLTLDTTIFLIMRQDMRHTTAKKTRSSLTLNISTKLPKVVYRTKRLILLSLALVSVNLCLCVMSHLGLSSAERMYYTSRWRWLKKRLQKELMLIFSTSLSKR